MPNISVKKYNNISVNINPIILIRINKLNSKTLFSILFWLNTHLVLII